MFGGRCLYGSTIRGRRSYVSRCSTGIMRLVLCDSTYRKTNTKSGMDLCAGSASGI